MSNPGVIIPLGVEDPVNIPQGTIAALTFDVNTGVAGITVASGTVDFYIPGTDRKFVEAAAVGVTAGVTIAYTLNLPGLTGVIPGMYEVRFDLTLSNGETKKAPFRLKISDFG